MSAVYFLLQVQHLSFLDSGLNQKYRGQGSQLMYWIYQAPWYKSILSVLEGAHISATFQALSSTVAPKITTPSATTSEETIILRSNPMALVLWTLHLNNKSVGRSGFWTIPLSPLLRSYLRSEAQIFKACVLSVMYVSSSYSISWHLLTSDIDSQMPGYHSIQPRTRTIFSRTAIPTKHLLGQARSFTWV